MNIRLATMNDANSVQKLISQLGYPHPLDFIETKLCKLLESNSDMIVVAEHRNHIVGLITLHFSVQLAFAGDFMSIGYLVVDEECRGQQIGKQLEEYASNVASEKKCSLIEVFSQAKRLDAHRFYARQGYQVAEKFFSKDVK